VYPVRVVEQVVRKSLEGETISYQVEIPSKDENKRFELSKLGPNIHSDLNKVRELLMKNAASRIDELITLAGEMAKSTFGVEVLPLPNVKDPPSDEGVEIIDDRPVDDPFLQDDEKVKITLPDGSVANVNLPKFDENK
jgi:hypothetical protein